MSNTNLILGLLDHYSYYAIFLIILIGELGIPIPIPASSELLFFYTGYRIYLHKINFFYALVAGTAGDFLGSMVLFLVFFYLGEFQIIKKLEKKLFVHENINQLKENFKKNSIFLILLARLTPFIRVYTSPVAGIIEISPFQFSLLSFLGSLTWVTVLITIGVKIAPEFKKVQEKLASFHNISTIIAVVIGALIVGYIIYMYVKNRQKN